MLGGLGFSFSKYGCVTNNLTKKNTSITLLQFRKTVKSPIIHSLFCRSFTAFVVLSLKNFKGGLWLGLVREANSAAFSWSDNSLTLYTSWATKEPNRLRTQRSCVVASNSYSNAGLWKDVDCSERNGFICRIRQGRHPGDHSKEATKTIDSKHLL